MVKEVMKSCPYDVSSNSDHDSAKKETVWYEIMEEVQLLRIVN